MKKTPSVLVPCCNEEDTLAEVVGAELALDSADLAVEALIVDDCSQDGSVKIACECAIKYRPRTFSEGGKIGWRDGFRALW